MKTFDIGNLSEILYSGGDRVPTEHLQLSFPDGISGALRVLPSLVLDVEEFGA